MVKADLYVNGGLDLEAWSDLLLEAADELAKRIKAKVVIIALKPDELPGTDDFFSFFDYDFKRIS